MSRTAEGRNTKIQVGLQHQKGGIYLHYSMQRGRLQDGILIFRCASATRFAIHVALAAGIN
jgi:hypothetical protein